MKKEEKDLADDSAWWSRMHVYVGVRDVIWGLNHAHDLISEKRDKEGEEPLVNWFI